MKTKLPTIATIKSTAVFCSLDNKTYYRVLLSPNDERHVVDLIRQLSNGSVKLIFSEEAIQIKKGGKK